MAETQTFGDRFVADVPDIPLATMADLRARLAEVGVDVGDVERGGLRIDVTDHAAGGKLVLVADLFARGDQGQRYMDTETREVAKECRRFFITEDWHFVAESASSPASTA